MLSFLSSLSTISTERDSKEQSSFIERTYKGERDLPDYPYNDAFYWHARQIYVQRRLRFEF